MHWKFNEIRSYDDSEVEKVVKHLAKEKMFKNLVLQFIPSLTVRQLHEKLSNIKTIYQFQTEILYPIAKSIIKKSTQGLSYEGLENLEKDKPYLLISNHRDIVLDPSFLNLILYENGIKTSEIAIGNNLLIYSWIKDMVKLSKSFVVKRNLGMSQIYDQSMLLSSYIREVITKKRTSVWMSQREGRTKDGDDKTQQTVLKMLAMSTDKAFAEGFSELNILPVSISYEYEACDILKAIEMRDKLLKTFNFKTAKDDLKNMLTGLMGQKGRIHFSFGKPINESLGQFARIENKAEQYRQLAVLIDEQIYKNYRLFPVNYIAYDVLNKSNIFRDKYSQEEKAEFINYIYRKLSKVKDDSGLLESFLIGIYANPVKNCNVLPI
jgi:1-acyl-sn-glycerol-3-phosphate acyltransferase